MKAICKRWIATPIVILILSLLPVSGSFAQAVTPCDIETSLPVYQIGDVVELSVVRLTNPSSQAQSFEWKLWLESPAFPILSLINMGSDSSLVLPGGFDVDFATLIGPVQLITLDNVVFPAGTYTVGCRFLDPVTGAEHPAADVIVFTVN